MASTCTGTINLNLQALITAALAITGQTANAQMPVVISQTLAAGTGAGQINQIWATSGTLAASGTLDLDLNAPGVTDAVGNALTFARVKAIFIQNSNALEADSLVVGNKAATSGWTSFISPNTGQISVPGGGFIMTCTPGATGQTVTSNSVNKFLHLANPGGNAIVYNIIILGCNA